jgi:hypothetical protein
MISLPSKRHGGHTSGAAEAVPHDDYSEGALRVKMAFEQNG